METLDAVSQQAPYSFVFLAIAWAFGGAALSMFVGLGLGYRAGYSAGHFRGGRDATTGRLPRDAIGYTLVPHFAAGDPRNEQFGIVRPADGSRETFCLPAKSRDPGPIIGVNGMDIDGCSKCGAPIVAGKPMVCAALWPDCPPTVARVRQWRSMGMRYDIPGNRRAEDVFPPQTLETITPTD